MLGVARFGGPLFGLVLAAVFAGAPGCARGEKTVASAPVATPAPQGRAACGVDEVREFRCDALLPWSSALPAAAPYESCPSAMEVHDAVFPPASGAGRFDAARTEYARKRAPPGQQCCYSWCGKLEVVDAAVVTDACKKPLAFRESYCVSELESGTRGDLASEPYDRCALAIRPPGAAVFSVPDGALLEPNLTAARRKRGESLCCYGWCSIAPPGTGLERGR